MLDHVEWIVILDVIHILRMKKFAQHSELH